MGLPALLTLRSHILHQAAFHSNCNFIPPGGLTYWPAEPSKLPDVIDFLLVEGLPSSHFQAECNPDLSSDHVLVTLTFAGVSIYTNIFAPLINKSTDWDTYCELIGSQIKLNTKLRNPNDFDQAAKNFASLLSS